MNESGGGIDNKDALGEAQRVLSNSRTYEFFLPRETAEYWSAWARGLDIVRESEISRGSKYSGPGEGREDMRKVVAEVLKNALDNSESQTSISLRLDDNQVKFLLDSNVNLTLASSMTPEQYVSVRTKREKLRESFNKARKEASGPGLIRKFVNRFRPQKPKG